MSSDLCERYAFIEHRKSLEIDEYGPIPETNEIYDSDDEDDYVSRLDKIDNIDSITE